MSRTNWIIYVRGGDGKSRRQHWRIVESIHSEGKKYLNLTRKGKVKTVRVK